MGAEIFPGACIEEIGSLKMAAGTEGASGSEEGSAWAWLEHHCCFERRESGTDQLLELVIDMRCFSRTRIRTDVPGALLNAIRQGHERNLRYIVVHRGGMPESEVVAATVLANRLEWQPA